MSTPTRDEIAAVLAPLCTGELKDEAPTPGSTPCSRDYARADAVLALLAAPPAPAPSSDEGRDELAELLTEALNDCPVDALVTVRHVEEMRDYLADVLRAHGYGSPTRPAIAINIDPPRSPQIIPVAVPCRRCGYGG